MRVTAWLQVALLPALAACAGEPPRPPPEAEPTASGVALMTWAHQQEVTAGDISGSDLLGQSVAVSGDTAIVGAPSHFGGMGAVYIFVRAGGAWTQQQELMPLDGSSDGNFGRSVSMSGDTAIVGAPSHASSKGAAYVYVRSGGTWTQQQALLAPDGMMDDQLGRAVAVDGDTAIVGALTALSLQGAAYVYVRAGGAWSLQQKLAAADTPSAPGILGYSVALAADTALVGAPSDGVSNPGAAYVFARSGTAWSQQQKLSSNVAVPGDNIGFSVAVDGDTALVGAPGAGGGEGTAYVFARSGAVWAQQQQLISPSLIGLGTSLALRGNTALVGGPGQQFEPGGVQVFGRVGASFAPQQLLALSTGVTDDLFGAAVALDDKTLIVGAPAANGAQGQASVFAFGSVNGEACASAAECFSGACVDGVCCVTAACPGAGACNAAEHCLPGTGTCSVTPLNEGAPCDDGDACTHHDACQGGRCTPASTTLCPPPDECHEFGACDPGTGTCFNAEKHDGAPCSTGMCKAGACGEGVAPKGSGGSGCNAGGAPAGGVLPLGLGVLLLLRGRRLRHDRGPRHLRHARAPRLRTGRPCEGGAQ